MADEPQEPKISPPVEFSMPGFQPDTLFHQPLHVKSTALKMHSAFFRKFLDSPDKSSDSNCVDCVWKLDTIGLAKFTAMARGLLSVVENNLWVSELLSWFLYWSFE